MTDNMHFDVIIIGGSYSGLSAGMALGRAMRKVLIIDDGKPCNIQTPHSHNFLTQDGKTPQEISAIAREQLGKYQTVRFYAGLAVSVTKTSQGFEIRTQSGDILRANKLVFGTGVRDLMPDIPGFKECWGISIIHCPYCHGYEVQNEITGVLGNGDAGFNTAREIYHWTKSLTLFTNGESLLTEAQTAELQKHQISIVETKIDSFVHRQGQLQHVLFLDGFWAEMKALYARPPYQQHSNMPETLGCELTEQGHLKVDMFQKTSVRGVFACGDNSTPLRSVSNAVAMGTIAGAMVNKEMIEEEF